MSDFQKEATKIQADATAVMQIIKLISYPLVFLFGFLVGALVF